MGSVVNNPISKPIIDRFYSRKPDFRTKYKTDWIEFRNGVYIPKSKSEVIALKKHRLYGIEFQSYPYHQRTQINWTHIYQKLKDYFSKLPDNATIKKDFEIYLHHNAANEWDIMKYFRNKHKGEKAVICALGDSLNLFKPKKKRNYTIFGVNDINEYLIPDYQVISENIYLGKYPDNPAYEGKSQAILNTTAKTVFSVYDCAFTNVVPIKLDLISLKDDDIDNILDSGKNFAFRKVPTAAISLAITMGFTRIGIIGMDITGDRAINNHSNALGMAGDRLSIFNAYCHKIMEWCKYNGVRLYNLSPVSVITAFPKMDMKRFCDDQEK